MPNKLLEPFYKGKGVLELLVERFQAKQSDIPLIIATTDRPVDDGLAEMCHGMGLQVFRGSETDVLWRFIMCARKYDLDAILRVCADNPFFDIESSLELLSFMDVRGHDCVAFRMKSGLPSIRTHLGFWGEAIKRSALEFIAGHSSDLRDHEHVTRFIYENPEYFDIKWIPAPGFLADRNDLRLTLDTKEDFELERGLYKFMQKQEDPFSMRILVRHIDANPEVKREMEAEILKHSK
jgi:spore coat polysaccharide biosynthesis protein SpsF